jgi:dUTP pyrophosphatase
MTDLNGDVSGSYWTLPVPVFKFAVMDYTFIDNKSIYFIPTKAHDNDTGWDVKAAANFTLRAGQYAKIPLGFRVFAPPGYWLKLHPRSSSFAKKQLHALYGVIDEGYESEMVFACQYIPDVSAMGQDLKINFGDAIGQLIPVKRQEMKVETISNEEFARLTEQRKGLRGTGGFGSTDGK